MENLLISCQGKTRGKDRGFYNKRKAYAEAGAVGAAGAAGTLVAAIAAPEAAGAGGVLAAGFLTELTHLSLNLL
jgi:hypothetical protein